jgi:Ca-activated chloride channel family protein
MNTYNSYSMIRPARTRRGAILPLIAFLLPVIIIMLGFSVDLALMQSARVELRAATDAAARAGAIELAQTEDATLTREAAIRMASLNTVVGTNLVLRDADVELGRSERDGNGKWNFAIDARPWNSVRVRGDRSSGSAGGPIRLFFNSFYGGPDFESQISAVSTFLNVDVCLVLDRSGSMEGQKLIDLKIAVEGFLFELEQTNADEQVALASYSDSSRLDETLTTDYSAIRDKLNSLEADGTTAIGEGLYSGIAGVTGVGQRDLSTPVIVLMTDGLHNTGIEPIVPAGEAAAGKITVHTITFGGDADFDRMQAVAAEAGGRHYHADTGSELSDVFRQIARSLPIQLTQ